MKQDFFYFTCLSCEADYGRKYHKCNSMCTPLNVGIHHVDFCDKCIELIVENFEEQMRRRRLRLE